MTPTETVAFLRNYNVWRRGNLDGQPMPDPREIGKAIDAAVDHLDRLEAAEKERNDAKAAAENIALKLDYLRSKLETAENAQNDWLRANAPGGWIDNLRIENEALRAEIIHIKEVEFPRKAQAVADGWRGKLEAAEKERDDVAQQLAQSEIGKRKISEERDAAELMSLTLRAKIAEMERQEPVAWTRKLAMGPPSFGCVTDLKYRPSNMPESAYMPLYALPGAQTQGEEK